MDDKDFEKIEDIIKERKYANDFFLKSSKVYRTFVELEQKTFSDGELKKKIQGINRIRNLDNYKL